MKANILVSSKVTNKRIVIGTHDGIFHSDEVVACAILSLLNASNQIEIVRSKDIDFLESKNVSIMIDVGGGKYDHHQTGGNGQRANLIPYASAGLVWRDYGQALIRKCYTILYGGKSEMDNNLVDLVFHEIDANLIQDVDNEDNQILTSYHSFSFISKFLPIYNSSFYDFDRSFYHAVQTTMDILQHEIFDSISKFKCTIEIEEMISCNLISPYGILEIPCQEFPWLDPIVTFNYNLLLDCSDSAINFVIFPYNSGGWAAQCVPPSVQRKFEQRIPFPKEWANHNIREISGVADADFCHNNCFFVRAGSKEGVIKLCEFAFKEVKTGY